MKPQRIFTRRSAWVGTLFAMIIGSEYAAAATSQTSAVFDAPPASYDDLLAPAAGDNGRVLRGLSVEERAGVERHGDLVRVPVFFAEKECANLDDLEVVSVGDENAASPIAWQADDIRRGPDGGISRVHLWFAVDLKTGGRKSFQLVRRTAAHLPPATRPIRVETTGDEIRVMTDAGPIVWSSDGTLRSIAGASGSWEFGREGAFPRVVLRFPASKDAPAAEIALDRSTTDREVEWSTGILFAKIRVKLRQPDGVTLEQEYRIPRQGSEIVITAAIFPGERAGGVVVENRILEGSLKSGAAEKPVIERVPAGIRYALRAEHAYTVSALTRSPTAGALLAVPLVLGGTNGQWRQDDDKFSLQGHRGLRRGDEGEKETLRAYWTEVRLAPAASANPIELWKTYRAHLQPLVAVVDEPRVTLDQLHAALVAVVREMKPVGWRQEAGRAAVLGDTARMAKFFQHTPSPRETDVESLLRGARGAAAKLTNNGERKLREDEKGRAYGGLDPYHITYAQSAAAAIAVLGDAPPSVTAANLAMARGAREFGGHADRDGLPYIDCFARTLNMQMGPVLFGLTAGASAGDTALVRFYRDLATSPPVQGVFGRGQRPYTGAPAAPADQTDYLYQGICDFWLRSAELLGQENLSLHPLAYARYTDCIDVMADRYHGVASRDKKDAPGHARANFFRGQAHTHRWLSWAAAPYIRVLEDPAEHSTIGLTEAVRYTQALKGRWKNWPELTFYVLADLLVRDALPRYVRPELPNLPEHVIVQRKGGGADLSWTAVQGAAEYRVYRAETAGGPYRWINSPYVESALVPVVGTNFRDTTATEKSTYMITAVDAAGRESRWADSP